MMYCMIKEPRWTPDCGSKEMPLLVNIRLRPQPGEIWHPARHSKQTKGPSKGSVNLLSLGYEARCGPSRRVLAASYLGRLEPKVPLSSQRPTKHQREAALFAIVLVKEPLQQEAAQLNLKHVAVLAPSLSSRATSSRNSAPLNCCSRMSPTSIIR